MSETGTIPVVSTEEINSAIERPRRPRKAPKAPEAVTVPETPPVLAEKHPGCARSETHPDGATAVLADLTVTPSPPSVDSGKPRSVVTTPDGITVFHY